MASRGPRMNDFEERDYYPPPRRSAPDLDDRDFRRRATTRSPPRSRAPAPVRELDEVDVRVRDRETDRGPPAFLREDDRRGEAGPMVLRQRDVETFDRRRHSPSPVRVREERVVRRPRSVSPPHFHDHDHEHETSRTRVYERERVRSPSVARHRSPSPRRFERRRRSSSGDREHDHIRIVERERERIPSPSPSPPPPPPVVRGPTLEREVITHYRDIDHGTIHARRPSPPPAPRPRHQERETDIDINLSKNRTEVDIHRSSSRVRSRSRERRSHFHDDELVVRRDMDRLTIDDRHSGGRRRAHSAAPLASPMDEEARYITSKIDSRGRHGEAWHGATKDWAIVDVPPGTERVRMDGAGGGQTDTTWSKYSGVRRTQFNPERDGALVPAREPSPRRSHNHLDVSVYDREREIDIDIERTTDRRIARAPPPPPPQPTKDMWTEITKDLVVREAIIQMGYEFEETEFFFYVMDYLRYDDVLRLTELSADIKRARKDRAREIQWEREIRDDVHVDFHRHRHQHSRPRSRPRRRDDDGWVTEREVVYDSRGPARGYIR